MQKAIRFWLAEMQVDGFRLDAIKHLIEDGRRQENTPATHAWLQDFHTFYKGINPDAVTVGEVWSPTTEVVKYIGDQVDLAFEFDTAGAIIQSARLGNNRLMLRTQQQSQDQYPVQQYATFITNHDQDRMMSQLNGDVGKAKVAASLLLTGPGVPFIYYGEEVGQKGRKPDENIRTPMQWTAAENAGFTTAARAWRTPQGDYETVNVALAAADPASLLNHYRRLIQLRSAYPALRLGDWQAVAVEDFHLYAALRSTTAETILVVINLGPEAIADYQLTLATGPLRAGTATEIFGDVAVLSPTLNANGGFDDYRPLAQLEPYATYLIKLQ
jgi:glycosidase